MTMNFAAVPRFGFCVHRRTGRFVASELFSGRTLDFAITGGTGRYRHARGTGTVQLPQDVPNMTDARFVLKLR